MKHLIPAAMLAVALSLPVGAIAGELPAPAPIPPREAQALHLTAAQQQQLDQIWSGASSRLKDLHSQARNQILGVLTPSQRTLLAQIAGNLAIAANPDEDAAAQQIQNSLSPQQVQRVLSLHEALKQQAMSLMQAAHAQAQNVLTPQQRQQIQQDMSAHFGHEGPAGPMEMHGMGGPMEMHGMAGPMGMPGRAPGANDVGHIILAMALHGGEMRMEYNVRIHTP